VCHLQSRYVRLRSRLYHISNACCISLSSEGHALYSVLFSFNLLRKQISSIAITFASTVFCLVSPAAHCINTHSLICMWLIDDYDFDDV